MSIHVHTLYYGGGITRPTHIGLVRGGFVTQDKITRSSMLDKLDFFLQVPSGNWLSPLMQALLAQSGVCTSAATGNYLATKCSERLDLGLLDPVLASGAHQPVWSYPQRQNREVVSHCGYVLTRKPECQWQDLQIPLFLVLCHGVGCDTSSGNQRSRGTHGQGGCTYRWLVRGSGTAGWAVGPRLWGTCTHHFTVSTQMCASQFYKCIHVPQTHLALVEGTAVVWWAWTPSCARSHRSLL